MLLSLHPTICAMLLVIGYKNVAGEPVVCNKNGNNATLIVD